MVMEGRVCGAAIARREPMAYYPPRRCSDGQRERREVGGRLLSVMVMMRFKRPGDFFWFFFLLFSPMVMDGEFPSFSPVMTAEQAVCPQSPDDGLDDSLD